MPINVNGTELIQDDGTVVNFTDLSGVYSSLYPNFTELPNPDPAVPDNVIDCNYSIHFLTPSVNNYPYQFSNQAMGDIITVVVDRGTAGNNPYFGTYLHAGGGDGLVMWSSTGVPSWSNHRYWMLTFFAAGGGPSNNLMRGFGVGYDGPSAGGNPIPTTSSNFIGRQSSAGIVAQASDVDIDNLGGSAFSFAGVRFTFYGDTTTDTFYATVYKLGGDVGNWYNAAGSSSTLSSSEVTVFSKVGIKPTAIRVVHGTASNPTSTDTGWNNVSNGNVAAAAIDVSSSASASGGAGTGSDSDARVITIYGRANGYDDTAFGTFRIESSAYAESNCFTGESLLYVLDPNNNVKTVKLEEAYEAYKATIAAGGEIKTTVLGTDGYSNQILDFRKTIGRTELFGINGGENFVTGGHPFLTTNGWKCFNLELGKRIRPDLELSQLEVGDVLVKVDPTTKEEYHETIESTTNEFRAAAVYSLDVEGPDSGTVGNDTYIVDGYVVHNK